MQWTPLLVTLALVAAGCSGSRGGAGTDDGFGDIRTAPASGKGIIRGLVLDVHIQPVEGADVQVQGVGATRSDTEGRFLFVDVEPGLHFVEVSLAGHATTRQSVDVVADVATPPIVKVQLERLGHLEPRVAYTSFQGYVGCSAQVANFVQDNICGIAGGVDPDKQAPISFGEERKPLWLQTELQWEHTQAFGERLGIIQYMVGDGGGRIGNVWGTSPITCRVGPEAPCDNGDGTGGGGNGLHATFWTDRVSVEVFANCFNQCVPGTALGIGAALQQEYTVFGSLFYNLGPAPGWTYIADGAHPIGSS